MFSLATANKLECEVLVLNAKPRKLTAVEKTEQVSDNLFNEVYDYVVEEFDPDKDDDVDNSDLDTENEGDDQLSSDDTSDSDSETNANLKSKNTSAKFNENNISNPRQNKRKRISQKKGK